MKNVIGWILAVFLALVFALAGGVKLIGAPVVTPSKTPDRILTLSPSCRCVVNLD